MREPFAVRHGCRFQSPPRAAVRVAVFRLARRDRRSYRSVEMAGPGVSPAVAQNGKAAEEDWTLATPGPCRIDRAERLVGMRSLRPEALEVVSQRLALAMLEPLAPARASVSQRRVLPSSKASQLPALALRMALIDPQPPSRWAGGSPRQDAER